MALMLAPVLAQALAVDVGDRSEARLRMSTDIGVLEADSQPYARLRISGRTASLDLAYSPSITITPDFSDDEPQVLAIHTVSADAPLRFRFTTIQLSHSANYGQLNLGAVPVTSPSAIADGDAEAEAPSPDEPQADVPQNVQDVRTTVGIVRFGGMNSTLSIGHNLTRRTGIGAFAGYQLNGGIDDSSQQVIPLQKGPVGGMSFYTDTSRSTSLTTAVSGRSATNSTGTRASGVELTQSVDHNFTRVTQLNLSGGFSLWESDPFSEPAFISVIAVGSAEVQHTAPFGGGRLLFRGNAFSGPVIDQFTALVDVRAQANVSADWRRRALGLGLAFFGSTSIETQTQTFRAIAGEARAVHFMSRNLQVSEGLRVAWQEFEDVNTFPLTAGLFIAITVQETVVGQ